MHIKGIVFLKTPQKAIEWLRKSTESGFVLAQFDLAASLHSGSITSTSLGLGNGFAQRAAGPWPCCLSAMLVHI